ncbi:hypothetical protein [Luteimonas sp. e5]
MLPRLLLALPLLIAAAPVLGAPNCANVPQVMPLPAGATSPLSSEFLAPMSDLGSPTGVLSRAYEQAVSAESVLLRMQIESCRVARAIPAPSPVDPNDPAAYKPRTEYDNTPWRFSLTQGGKRMTADEFDAWMQARGIRIAGRKPVQTADAGATPPAETPAEGEAEKQQPDEP